MFSAYKENTLTDKKACADPNQKAKEKLLLEEPVPEDSNALLGSGCRVLGRPSLLFSSELPDPEPPEPEPTWSTCKVVSLLQS